MGNTQTHRWGVTLIRVAVGVVMLVALTVVHLPNGFFMPNGIEYTFTLLAASAALVLTGRGALAVDNRVRPGGTAAPSASIEPRAA